MTRPRPPDFLATPTTPCPKSGVVATPGLTPLPMFCSGYLPTCMQPPEIYLYLDSFLLL